MSEIQIKLNKTAFFSSDPIAWSDLNESIIYS